MKLYLREGASSYAPTAGDKSTTNAKYTLGANNASSAQQSLQLLTTKGLGAGGVSHSFNSDATTSTRTNYLGRWTSQPLAAQSIGAGTWNIALGLVESNISADSVFSICIYLANQGGSSIKATIYDSATDLATEWSASATSAGRTASVSGSAVSAVLGDVLVVEVFRNTAAVGQGMATAYAQLIYFAGSTEPTNNATITTNDVASYLESPANIDFNAVATATSPADGATVSDTTPDLTFTSLAPTGNNNEFQIQIFDPITFTLLDSYSDSNISAGFTLSSGNFQAAGQSFLGNDSVLNRAKFWLRNGAGSPTGNATAKVYLATGTHGTSAKPTGSALATSSTTLDVSTIAGSNAEYTFNFTGANRILLTSGVTYVVVVNYSGGDGSNNIIICSDGTSPTHAGNGSSFSSGVWNTSSSDDFIFFLYYAPVSIDKLSASDTGFTNQTNGGDTHPFNNSDTIAYTVQTVLADGEYYWWVRAKDTVGNNAFGAYSTIRSFTVAGIAAVPANKPPQIYQPLLAQ